jgi:hypothetical protein
MNTRCCTIIARLTRWLGPGAVAAIALCACVVNPVPTPATGKSLGFPGGGPVPPGNLADAGQAGGGRKANERDGGAGFNERGRTTDAEATTAASDDMADAGPPPYWDAAGADASADAPAAEAVAGPDAVSPSDVSPVTDSQPH